METRVCIIGPSGAGKSTIASRLGESNVSPKTNHSGVGFTSCEVFLKERTVNLEILDISGEESFTCLAPIYFKAAKAALCVFDLTSQKSYQFLHHWIKCVRNNASYDCMLIVVGNKADLEADRQISSASAEKNAKSFGAKYCEVSALTGVGLLGVMVDLVKDIVFRTDCSSTYAAKRAIISNNIEYISPKKEEQPNRFFLPLRKMSFSISAKQTSKSRRSQQLTNYQINLCQFQESPRKYAEFL